MSQTPNLNPLPDEITSQLWNRVQIIWDVGDHYWYPLTDCRRNDVISFDVGYIDDEDHTKIKYLKQVLQVHGSHKVYEFLEDGGRYITTVEDMFPFYAPEGFWCDDRMDWIIYASHEGTFTIGGAWLLKRLKSAWTDWRRYTKWDSKNV